MSKGMQGMPAADLSSSALLLNVCYVGLLDGVCRVDQRSYNPKLGARRTFQRSSCQVPIP